MFIAQFFRSSLGGNRDWGARRESARAATGNPRWDAPADGICQGFSRANENALCDRCPKGLGVAIISVSDTNGRC